MAAAVIVPLSRCTCRRAYSAARGSCVTITTVLPCSLVQHLQEPQDLVGGGAVEIAGGLIADQERGIGDDGARDGDTLLLPARQLLRLVAGAVREADQRERDPRPALPLGGRQIGEQQRQLHVPLRRQRGQQVVELEDEAHVRGAPGGQLAPGQAIDAPALHDDDPAGRRVEPADQIQERGLAGSRWAHQRHEVALGDVEVDAVQRLDPLASAAIDLGHAADLHQGSHGDRGATLRAVGHGHRLAVLEGRRRGQDDALAVAEAAQHVALARRRPAQRHAAALDLAAVHDEDHRARRHRCGSRAPGRARPRPPSAR